MPYIKQEERKKFEEVLSKIGKIDTPGQLNYLFTKLLIHYVDSHGFGYASLNEVMGALECCKQELYRQWVAPYENNKAAINGNPYVNLATSYSIHDHIKVDGPSRPC